MGHGPQPEGHPVSWKIGALQGWTRPAHWSLKQRVLLPAAVVAIAVMALSSALSAWRLSSALFTEQRAKGLAIATALAGHAQELMLSADASTLQELCGQYDALDGVSYVYLQDAGGKVLYHTFTPEFPSGLETKNQPPANSVEATFGRLKVDGSSCLDVAMPILAGTMGTAHVGVDLDRTRRQIWGMTLGNLALLVLCMVPGLAWLWRQTQAALRPLDYLCAAAEGVEKRGDLTWKSDTLRDDETGRLARAFEGMLGRLREMPQQLAGHTRALAGEVSVLNAHQMAQGELLAAQAHALNQAAVTSEEVRQISRQAAEQARDLIVEAGSAVDMSKRGVLTLGESLGGLAGVRERVEKLAQDVEALDSRARNIEGIIDTVKDLADQSNLLALNAAIEAMRAGEHGKGFGLVAREIRALADQSIAATQRVRLVLDDLSQGIRQAAFTSREGIQVIQMGLQSVRETSHDVTEVQASVEASVGRLQNIARVVQQQDAALVQILSVLAEQGERIKDAASQQERTAEAVVKMRTSTEGLSALVESFKV
jgi:methyl-accepting chemotaxis protein